MFSYIFKNRHFPSFCVLGFMLISLFAFIFQLVAINASRDAKSDNIRRIEHDCAKLAGDIKSLEETKARLCNAEVLRCSPAIQALALKDVPNEKIIRVRTPRTSVPSGRQASAFALQPKALAVELNELATLSSHR